MIMNLNSLDVGVLDMRRALDFYRRLFSAEPIDVAAGCALFDVGAVSFGIVSTAQVDGELRFGKAWCSWCTRLALAVAPIRPGLDLP
jgi:hypothetical protein